MANRRRRTTRTNRPAKVAKLNAESTPAQHTEGMISVASRVAKADGSSRQIDETASFVETFGERAIPTPYPLKALLEFSELNAIHSACIDAKVADAVGRGWCLETEDDTEDGVDNDQDATERKLRDQLADLARPARMTFAKLCHQAAREYESCGQGAWEVCRDGDAISELHPIPAHTVRACKKAAAGDPQMYVQERGGKKVYFKEFGTTETVDADDGRVVSASDNPANEIILFREYSWRSQHYGIPRWVSAIPAIAEMTAIREYNVSWFGSGGAPDRSIHVTAESTASAEKVAEQVTEQIEESKGEGHVTLVTSGDEKTDLKVQMLTTEEGKRDGQFADRREDLVKEVLIAHQVPPYRVGWAELGSLGGSAAAEMIESYRFGVVEPLQEVIEQTLAVTLFGEQGIPTPGYTFHFTDLDWSSVELDVKKAEMAVRNGLATPNQARQMIGESADDDPALDRFYIYTPSGPIPFSDAPETMDTVKVLREFKDALRAVVKDAEAAPDTTPELEAG